MPSFADEQYAILRHETITQIGESGWEPAIQSHIGEHAGAIEETGLRGDKKEGGFGGESRKNKSESGAVRPTAGQALEEYRIESFVLGRLDFEQQVAKEQSGHRNRQRQSHVKHCPFAGLDPWLSKN